MNKYLFKEFFLNFLITFLITIFSFFNNKYFVSHLGYEELGFIKLIIQLTMYLGLAELGLGTASLYILYKPLIEQNESRINIIVSTIDNLYKKIAVSVFLIGIISSFFIQNLLKNDVKNTKLIWLIYVLGTSISYLTAKYTILLTADQKYINVRIIQGFTKMLSYVLQLIILIKFKSLLLYSLVFLLENILQIILYKKNYKKYYSYIKKVKNKEDSILKDTKKLIWHKISSVIVFNTDYIIISKFLSLSIVGVYSSYMMIIQSLGMLISIVLGIITPRIGQYISINNKNNIFKLWRRININFVFIGYVLSITTFYLINDFILIWLGKNFLFSKMTLILLLINFFINTTRWITEIFKNNLGYFNDIYTPILEALLNIILSIILVKKMGLNGVILGTMLTNILIIYLLKPMLVFKHCFNIKITKYLIILLRYLILILLSLVFTVIIVEKYELVNNIFTWKDWLFKSIKISIINLLVGFLIFLCDEDYRTNIINYLNKIRRINVK